MLAVEAPASIPRAPETNRWIAADATGRAETHILRVFIRFSRITCGICTASPGSVWHHRWWRRPQGGASA